AWTLSQGGRSPEAQARLRAAARAPAAPPIFWAPPADAWSEQHGVPALPVPAPSALVRGRTAWITDLAQQALTGLPEPEGRGFMQSTIVAALGNTQFLAGELEAAEHTYAAAAAIGRATGNTGVAIVALSRQARVQAVRGRLHAATALYHEALALI